MATSLKDISVSQNMRGMCSLCNKKSMRWAKWRHVELWYKNHSCIEKPLNTKTKTNHSNYGCGQGKQKC
mgnify:CR=1 FL=1|jgi:hypothetical protein